MFSFVYIRLELPNDRNESYLMTLREHVNPNVQMVVCVLSNNKKDRYDAIKKFCCIDCPGRLLEVWFSPSPELVGYGIVCDAF